LQASLNIEAGPLFRAGYFDLGPLEQARLLLVIHHLAVDGVSWQVLFSDLTQALEQLEHGKAVILPSKTTSFQQWSRRLEEYAQTKALRQEMQYWDTEARLFVADLPCDHPDGNRNNVIISQRVVETSLSAPDTHALLQDVPSVYHTQINDVLLTGLGKTLKAWTGTRSVLIDLEGHGRESLFEEVDLSRTVGWFTSLFPVLLELPGSATTGEWLKSIKEQLHRIPTRGLGYGVLRYLCTDPQIREQLASLPRAQISFNYLGQWDNVVGESTQITADRQSIGRLTSQLGNRSHALSVLSRIRDGCLEVSWTYSENAYYRATEKHLAETFLSSLREIISHCKSPEAGGFTPSDFPRARVSQASLDRLAAGLRKN
jgi:non-ribosomal peptide synthase protein (TIGR01720 family)